MSGLMSSTCGAEGGKGLSMTSMMGMGMEMGLV